ncbi:MAG: hypothetical protein LBM60_04305, partial [Clostridium sp.]|nr:hypothetical protein [Clostridium sp.]
EINKNNLQVVYYTNVPFNIVQIGIYQTQIELASGDVVEYYAAGNGIYHDRTRVTNNGVVRQQA